MANAFHKEVRRSITNSLGRFLAIAIIAGLGCGFFAGLQMTSIDMDLSADEFYDGTNLSDLYVISTLGLDETNIEQIAEVEGVESVAGVKMVDAYALIDDARYVTRFNSIDFNDAKQSDCEDGTQAISFDDAYINRPVLVEGTWPTQANECVIAADAVLEAPVEIGDVVRIVDEPSSEEGSFTTSEFTITGFVRSPYYLMTSNFGSSSLGSGEIETYAFVAESDFSEDVPFSGAFVTVRGAAQERFPSDSYDELVDRVIESLEGISEAICVQRLDDVRADAQAELDDAIDEYEASYASAMSQLSSAEQKLSSAKAQLDESARTLSSHERELADAKKELSDGEAKLAESRALLDEKQKQLAKLEAMASEEGSDPALLEMVAKAKQELVVGEALYEQSAQKLEEGKASYEEGRAALSQGYVQYEQGLAEYQDGLSSFASQKADALGELADARSQLDEAQQEIDDIDLPELFILNRSKNVGVAAHEADASRINQIAQVFPLIFFLVAALVVLTTMTRMVDEERQLIGTYKALGYGNGRIVSKYLVYAFITSGAGSILGIVILSQFLPQFIMDAYSIIYALPVSVSPLDVPIALLAFGLSVGITLLVTWLAVRATLRERPASLMLPRAPKPGKRILLERMGPLWRRFSFSSKVTARNLFRYKQRFFMAIIGVAGCTALLLTGLGLHNGINDIIEKQFGELQHFNLEISLSDDQSLDDSEQVWDLLEESDFVTETMVVGSESVLATASGSDDDIRAMVYVPEDLSAFTDFFTLRERIGGAPLSLNDEGAIITEKLASELGLSVGDSIDLYEQSTIGERSGDSRSVIISGIAEYYTGQRIFMTQSCYERVMGSSIEFTDIIAMASAPLEERSALATQLLEVPGVDVVSFYDEIIDTYKTMLETVNAVVWVLIIAAAILAFVVIYNLTNINITERTREIATLKVLGFTPRETNAYIFRETIILTVIGALVGLLLGVWMEGFVVVTAEVDEMMFGRDIHAMSYVIAFFLTIAFSIIVSLVMMPKIKSIDMVQSLKSVD